MEPSKCAVTRLDGKSMVSGEDGLIHGEPLNLTDEQRAALPLLGDVGPDEPNVFGTSNVA